MKIEINAEDANPISRQSRKIPKTSNQNPEMKNQTKTKKTCGKR
jgi:hypothetical protein